MVEAQKGRSIGKKQKARNTGRCGQEEAGRKMQTRRSRQEDADRKMQRGNEEAWGSMGKHGEAW